MPSTFGDRLKRFNDAYDDLIEILAIDVLADVVRLLKKGLRGDKLPAIADKKVRDAAELVKRSGNGLSQHPSQVLVAEIYSEMERLLDTGDFTASTFEGGDLAVSRVLNTRGVETTRLGLVMRLEETQW